MLRKPLSSVFVAVSLMTSPLLFGDNAQVQNVPPNAPGQQVVPGQTPPGQSGQVTWMTNYNEAAQMAKQQNKPILLFFTGSDWCGWCKKMSTEIFSTPDFARLVGGRFVFVDLDFPMNKTLPAPLADQNNQLKQKYGITGYPTVVILDANENFIAESGYRPGGGEAYAKYLLSLVQ